MELVRNAHRSQIVVKPVTHFDHESGKVYRFELGATDSHGERTTAEIIVEVTDVKRGPIGACGAHERLRGVRDGQAS